MNEENAFLEALKVAPLDDLTRLVYADWLDEHDRPAEAEYLRLTAELAKCKAIDPEAPEAARMAALAAGIPGGWIVHTASRFVAVLQDYNPRWKIAVIKVLRELNAISLLEAKTLSESCPVPIFPFGALEQTIAVRQRVRGVVDSANVAIRPADESHLTAIRPFQIQVVCCFSTEDVSGSALATVEQAAMEVFGSFATEAALRDVGLTRTPGLLVADSERLSAHEFHDRLSQMQELCVARSRPDYRFHVSSKRLP